METKLLIIRGNSGSGKTTTAKSLQEKLGRGTLLVSQDVVRRDMLRVHDREGNLAIDLIQQMAQFGKGKCEHVIVEGILYTNYYGEMLHQLIQFYQPHTYVYYYDLPFEETVRRHQLRSKREEFGEEALRAWWKPNDYLGVAGETILTKDMSNNKVVALILDQLKTDD